MVSLSPIRRGRCVKPLVIPKLQVLNYKPAPLVQTLCSNIFPLCYHYHFVGSAPIKPFQGCVNEIFPNPPPSSLMAYPRKSDLSRTRFFIKVTRDVSQGLISRRNGN